MKDNVSRVGAPTRTAFGKYQVLARIGRGGMGEVFLAVNVGPAGVSKLVVIKELRRDMAEVASARSMFLDEARLATRLNHPNVVQAYEVVEDGDSLYITMEFLDGQPLQRILRGPARARFPLPMLLRILADALAGLHYAHELADYDGRPLAVVHRDVSPQNIIVTYEGTTKLVDFGIAKAADATTVTESGVFKGKVHFSAPEQALCQPIDRRTDIFAVGMVLWEMCTGEAMWRNMPDAAVLLELATGRIPRARVVNLGVPEELDAICAKALSLSPADRYATAEEMRLAILGYLRKTGEPEGDLKEVLASAFVEERKKILATIEAETRALREASANSRKVRRVVELSLRPPAPEEAATDTRHTGVIDTRGSKAPPPALSRWRSPRALVGGAVTLALVATLGIYAFSRSDSTAPTDGASASALPPGSSSASPRQVHLRIVAQPPSARVAIDGTAATSNPYETDLPRDERIHRLTATAPGFETRTMDTRFDQDLSVDLALVPSATAAPATTPAPVVPAGPAPVQPGLGPRHKQRPIEEESPYAR